MTSKIYTIYSMSNSPYQEWQADFLDYSFAKSKQTRKLIRICAQDHGFPDRKIPLSKVGRTFTTPCFSKLGKKINWPVMNKPGSLKYFFKHHYSFNDDDILIFLDPDMLFTKPWIPQVKQGNVVGQRWKGYSQNYCQQTSIKPELCPVNDKNCIMFPFAICAGDMKKIVSDIEVFARKGYLKKNQWMADMSAFQIAMEKHKLICKAQENIGLCNNWNNNNDTEAPILHYCQPILDKKKNKIWSKFKHNSMLFLPKYSKATNRVDRDTLKQLRTYYKHIGLLKTVKYKSQDKRFTKKYPNIVRILKPLARHLSTYNANY